MKLLPAIPMDQIPIEFWKDHERNYPQLANATKYLLCVAGISVTAERVFSTADDMVTAYRAAIAFDFVGKLILSKKNITLSKWNAITVIRGDVWKFDINCVILTIAAGLYIVINHISIRCMGLWVYWKCRLDKEVLKFQWLNTWLR